MRRIYTTLIILVLGISFCYGQNSEARISCDAKTPLITDTHTFPDTLIAVNDTPYVSYQWYRDSMNVFVPIPGATDSFLVLTQGGSYAVYVVDSNGCSISVGSYPFITIGIVNYSFQSNTMKISPNPAKNQINIQVPDFKNATVRISIVDVLGKIVCTTEREIKKDLLLDVMSLPSGIYFVEVLNDKIRWIGRMVKG